MTDSLAWRRSLGVLGPSTNTVVQPDFDDLRVPGVTPYYPVANREVANFMSGHGVETVWDIPLPATSRGSPVFD